MKSHFKALLLLVSISLFLGGCASPRYTGAGIDGSESAHEQEIVVVRHSATKEGFLQTIENWLRKNDYKYTVVPDRSMHDLDKLTIEYTGHWSWDLALYLSSAHVEAFQGGQRVGRVEYNAPNTLNTNKFSVAAERIEYMLEVLFGRISAADATAQINVQN